MHACKGFLISFFVVSGFFAGVSGFTSSEISTFVSPDSSYAGFESFIDTVDSFLYLSVYQISSPSVAEELLALLREGKNITIIVDDSPAGGFPDNEKAILSTLQVNGAEVFLAGDEYRYYHGKYAVSDNETLFIATENLGDTGFPMPGAGGNRGWGATIEDQDLSQYFVRLFFTDRAHSQAFEAYEFDMKISAGGEAFNPVFEFETFEGSFDVTPVVAPDSAVARILSLLNSANQSIYIEQFYIYKYWGKPKTGSVEKNPNLFLESAIDAARRGVKVRILLDSTWYNIERDDPVSNYNTASYVNDISRREGLDLEARLVDTKRMSVGKVHTKGVIVDEKRVLISSVNWNENSPTNNREVGVIIDGAPAEYFAEIFLYD
jgi:phosphatidylserine/phosphatidylglycerophosphate/cardiolipin synthase-like enzyme